MPRPTGAASEQVAWPDAIPAGILVALVTVVFTAPTGPTAFYPLWWFPLPLLAAWVAHRSFGVVAKATLWALAIAGSLNTFNTVAALQPGAERLLLALQLVPLGIALLSDWRRRALDRQFARWHPTTVRALVILLHRCARRDARREPGGIRRRRPHAARRDDHRHEFRRRVRGHGRHGQPEPCRAAGDPGRAATDQRARGGGRRSPLPHAGRPSCGRHRMGAAASLHAEPGRSHASVGVDHRGSEDQRARRRRFRRQPGTRHLRRAGHDPRDPRRALPADGRDPAALRITTRRAFRHRHADKLLGRGDRFRAGAGCARGRSHQGDAARRRARRGHRLRVCRTSSTILSRD